MSAVPLIYRFQYSNKKNMKLCRYFYCSGFAGGSDGGNITPLAQPLIAQQPCLSAVNPQPVFLQSDFTVSGI